MRPNSLICRTFAFRSFKLWAITRLALSFVFALAGNNPLRLSGPTVAGIVILCTVMGIVEIRRNRELPMLGNLAVSPLWALLFISGPAIAGEIVLAVAAPPVQ